MFLHTDGIFNGLLALNPHLPEKEALQGTAVESMYEWKLRNVDSGAFNTMAHFHNIELYPMFIWFAFSKGPRSVTPEDAKSIWSASLNSAPNIENLILSIKGLRMSQFHDSVYNIFAQFRRLYVQELTMPFWGWIHPAFSVKDPTQYFKLKAWKVELLLEKPKAKFLEGAINNLRKENSPRRKSGKGFSLSFVSFVSTWFNDSSNQMF